MRFSRPTEDGSSGSSSAFRAAEFSATGGRSPPCVLGSRDGVKFSLFAREIRFLASRLARPGKGAGAAETRPAREGRAPMGVANCRKWLRHFSCRSRLGETPAFPEATLEPSLLGIPKPGRRKSSGSSWCRADIPMARNCRWHMLPGIDEEFQRLSELSWPRSISARERATSSSCPGSESNLAPSGTMIAEKARRAASAAISTTSSGDPSRREPLR